jgi:glycosyltransferase involved in cell wall biosynthesis
VDYYPEQFMIIVVDDGSKFPVTVDRVQSEIQKDYKIAVLRNEKNRGITHALNKGLEWIKEHTDSKFIARLDCGDECESGRFYKQMDYMNQHPETGLLGSWCVFENKKTNKRYYYRTPCNHRGIARKMYFKNVFIHPTVLFKTGLLEKTGYYPYDFPYAEDYALFWQFVNKAASHILNEYLVITEINPKGISHTNRRKQLKSRLKVVLKYGTDFALRTAGVLKIGILLLVPKELVLFLKNSLNRQ